ncbi:MAG: RNA-binding protein [Proteiniphilum sp.]|nr:RNA-binding protein [Proteiniphilum sp.]MDD3908490.1 RNA-binding protein [Proteiniphilum sp.]MDD4415979.1 RNA-binding protein [Proteiniphilum sp.]
MNIYVSNLSYDTTTESLQELFAEYGEISSANIIRDRISGQSRGFGFVEMPNDDNAQKAIDELNNSDFEGKTITVNKARPRPERNDGGYNRRRY